ncbi:MAG: DNA integrity scanning protein DisA nucleotide-binding domain protein [Chroococcidiopsidaceae cyanobacterium CP_BM_ER_R8_30]|nr:DNA integrity scanning protein DisA nucleotide-binding domain protein [Chroococcidiopsidaceae cyanobacterium CP_BM_ER_R8_30]
MSAIPSFLKEELKQYQLAAYVPELIQHQAVLEELSYALSPVIHEGKLQPYGFIVLNNQVLPSHESFCSGVDISLAEARRIADGCHSFSLFSEGQFKGVVMLDQDVQNELQLVQLQQELQAIICTTSGDGSTKIFCQEGVFIHQYRNWQYKPSVKRALLSILRCVPQANSEILQDILEFCFHDLSPRKIGATLVWCLVEPNAEELENMRPGFTLKQIQARVGDQRSLAVLRHLLAYNDGAAILNPQAQALGIGAFLKFSDISRKIIEARAGTRHTSAQRFSYDFAKAVVFVVSSDGPVTVFSDGMSVAGLKVDTSSQIAAGVGNVNSKKHEETCMFDLNDYHCQTCSKRLKLQESMPLELGVEAKLFCPICNHQICPSHSYLYAYVVKELAVT